MHELVWSASLVTGIVFYLRRREIFNIICARLSVENLLVWCHHKRLCYFLLLILRCCCGHCLLLKLLRLEARGLGLTRQILTGAVLGLKVAISLRTALY